MSSTEQSVPWVANGRTAPPRWVSLSAANTGGSYPDVVHQVVGDVDTRTDANHITFQDDWQVYTGGDIFEIRSHAADSADALRLAVADAGFEGAVGEDGWPIALWSLMYEDMKEYPEKYDLVRTARGRLVLREELSVLHKLERMFNDDNEFGDEWDNDVFTHQLDQEEQDRLDRADMFLRAGEEMDQFVKDCDVKEELLATQARSGQVGGQYLVPRQDIAWGRGIYEREEETPSSDHPPFPTWEENVELNTKKYNYFSGEVWFPESRPLFHPPGVMTPSDQMDAGDRVIVNATITINGPNYHSGVCDKGDIYIGLKFSSHIPPVGETVTMIVRLKDVTKAKTWMCVRVMK